MAVPNRQELLDDYIKLKIKSFWATSIDIRKDAYYFSKSMKVYCQEYGLEYKEKLFESHGMMLDRNWENLVEE